MPGSLSDILDWGKPVLRVRSVLVSIEFYLYLHYRRFCCIPSNRTKMTLRS